MTSLGTNRHVTWSTSLGVAGKSGNFKVLYSSIRLKLTGLVLVQRTSISMSSSVPRPCRETKIISTIQNTCRIKDRYYSSVVQYNKPREVGEKMSKGSQESGAWSGTREA